MSKLLTRARLVGPLLALGGLATGLRAQVVEHPSPPRRLAIQNARIVVAPGRIIEKGTVVMRDGLITAVGAGVTVSPDVWVVDGTGLTVYPGLINGMGTVGLKAPASNEPPKRSWGPEDRPASFPWRTAADQLNPRDPALAAWRAAGFTTAVVAPDRGFFAGQASVIDLADRDNQVVRTPVAHRINFDGDQSYRGYPSSLFGAIAYVKQVFFDATHYDQVMAAYEAAPNGHERPAYDQVLEPLRTALKAGRPVLYPGDEAREIKRVFQIAGETGTTPIVYGARHGYLIASEIAQHKVPVLVNVDWPSTAPDPDPDADPPLESLRFRSRAATTPAELDKAGVKFAFYLGGRGAAGSKLLANVRRSIELGLSEDAALRALTTAPAEIFGVSDRVGSLETGKVANAVVTDGNLFSAKTKVRYVFVDGELFDIAKSDTTRAAPDTGAKPAPAPLVAMVQDKGPVQSPAAILIKDATVMTAADAGTLTKASVLVRDGRIVAIGPNITAPADALVVDGTGKYLIPGIIDAHSHIASDDTNEGAVNVSAMVSIRDVLNPDDPSIIRAAAGGVTTANILHGSANPIGGQNAVIKMRWGADADGLVFREAPPGIKFALGENPKRAGGSERYPQSRMGVQDVIRQAFIEARDYRRQWQEYEARKGQPNIIAPRRDLKLEALAQILDGKRLVHAHSYRADEILQLIHVADEQGFKIATFQHVLEGYKVADEIARHGAGASTFSDWWAYKFEVYDAIPYNAALMTERGVVVSINSDDDQEMRHLNQEAAKAIKWGGLSENDALKLVTLNPAKQLGIANRVGSIEVGKDADLVLYNANPLTPYAIVLYTIIDGKIYFDRQHDLELRVKLANEKKELMERERNPKAPAAKGEESSR